MCLFLCMYFSLFLYAKERIFCMNSLSKIYLKYQTCLYTVVTNIYIYNYIYISLLTVTYMLQKIDSHKNAGAGQINYKVPFLEQRQYKKT